MTVKLKYSNTERLRRKEQRRQEALIRQAQWRSLSPREQLAELDRRGVRALRQRAKIQGLIDKETAHAQRAA